MATSPTFATIASDLFAFPEGCDLAGFGITRFNLPLLAVEFGRVGLQFRVSGRTVIDALDLYRRLEPGDLASAVTYYLGRRHTTADSLRSPCATPAISRGY